MRWTVLGASAVRPNRGGACSGYLLEADGQRILVDCGAGVVGRLRDQMSPSALDAVVISHGHPDHCLDLVTLRQALRYGREARRLDGVPVHVAPGMDLQLARLGLAFHDAAEAERADDFWLPQLRIACYDPSAVLSLGPLTVTFAPTRHYVPCWAMRFVDAAGRVVVFGADGGPSAAVAELARGADLLVLESTFARRSDHPDDPGHMAPDEAGRLAAAAGARRLLLTHMFDVDDAAAMHQAAAAACAVPVDMAREGATWTV